MIIDLSYNFKLDRRRIYDPQNNQSRASMQYESIYHHKPANTAQIFKTQMTWLPSDLNTNI